MEASIDVERMLEECRSEPLQQLLTSIRKCVSPLGTIQIPGLEVGSSSQITSQDFAFNRGDVFEIQGPAACGKSYMLYQMIATCIMPPRHLSVDLHGWGKAAILLDTDGSFNMSQFHRLLLSRISGLLTSVQNYGTSGKPCDSSNSVDIEDMAAQYLANLHIFRPTSSHQLAATVLSLPNFHRVNPHLRELEIGILAVDSMSAFYWKDRFSVERLRNARGGSSTTSMPLSPLHYILSALESVRLSHGPAIILTNWGLNPVTKTLPTGEPYSPFFKQHLHPFPSPFEHMSVPSPTIPLTPMQAPSSLQFGTHATVSGSRPILRPHVHLPLTCHITLSTAPPNPYPSSFDPLKSTSQKPPIDAVITHGFVRTPGKLDVEEFSFRITEDSIRIHHTNT